MPDSLSELHDQIRQGDPESVARTMRAVWPVLCELGRQSCAAEASSIGFPTEAASAGALHQPANLKRIQRTFADAVVQSTLREPANRKSHPHDSASDDCVTRLRSSDGCREICRSWLRIEDPAAVGVAVMTLGGYAPGEIADHLARPADEVQAAVKRLEQFWLERLELECGLTKVVDDQTAAWAGGSAAATPQGHPGSGGAEHEFRVELLSRMKPFCDMPGTIVAAIAEKLEEQQYGAGDVLLRQGESSGRLIVVVEGEVDVQVTDTQQTPHVIGRRVSRAVLGEISLLTGRPHSATVVAAGPVRGLVLSAVDFRRLAIRIPTLGVLLADVIGQRLGQEEIDALFGKNVHGYRIDRRLGRGGMAIVYGGQEIENGRAVALKMMLHPLAYDQKSVERFMHEARVVATLDHPHILQTYKCFDDYNTFFIVMQYCRGPTLQRVVANCGPLLESDARPILGQLADALLFAHQQGVIHRDLKPANVLFDDAGALRLSDFGLSRSQLSGDLTRQTAILGTPHYMAPEQLAGQAVDRRADLFAFGCVVFELLAGRKLYQQTNIVQLIRQQAEAAEQAVQTVASHRASLSDPLSDEILDLLARCLHVDPAQRDVSLAEVAKWNGPINPGLLD